MSEHTASFDTQVLVTDGTTKVTISGTGHEVSNGEMIIMPANESHALKSMTAIKMMLVMIRE